MTPAEQQLVRQLPRLRSAVCGGGYGCDTTAAFAPARQQLAHRGLLSGKRIRQQ